MINRIGYWVLIFLGIFIYLIIQYYYFVGMFSAVTCEGCNYRPQVFLSLYELFIGGYLGYLLFAPFLAALYLGRKQIVRLLIPIVVFGLLCVFYPLISLI